MARAILAAVMAACLTAIGCGGEARKDSEGASLQSQFDGFEVVPPIADADPTLRHSVSVKLPSAISIVGSGHTFEVSFPTMETVELSVGEKMVTGIMREDSIVVDGKREVLGIGLQGGLEFDGKAQELKWGDESAASSGKDVAYEQKVTVFETDMPAQHMWSPESGKHYKVLWEKVFREGLHR